MAEYDFILIGAGLTGIDAAYRLQTELPDYSYTVLEARNEVGGTWSLFRFPGVRSDSDLNLFGFSWRPWMHEKEMAEAHLIQKYIEDAARDEGIDKKIQFKHRVTALDWSSDEQRWTLSILADGGPKKYKAKVLISCTGYYDQDKPLQTVIPGIDNFQGTVAHPQFWPEGLDYANKKVVIIGSGATAITMVPAVAKTAGHVTMLQRSPSYVVSLPASNPVTAWLRKHLPKRLANPIIWWLALLQEFLFVSFCLSFPKMARKLIMSDMLKEVPENIDTSVHFNPTYPPFEQRLGMCPDGDFFHALRQDNCDIVTDHIETITTDGILTKSGKKIEADIIVTATGLHVHILSGLFPTVDGESIDVGKTYAWRGAMVTGVPNCFFLMGYTRFAWTQGASANMKLAIKVWKHMKKVGATSVVPVHPQADLVSSKPVVPDSSNYFVAAESRLPRVTDQSPWYGRKNAIYDHVKLWFGSVTKGLEYTYPSKKYE